MMLPLNTQNYKCATIASPIAPRNTPCQERPSKLDLFPPSSKSNEFLFENQNLPTPGLGENPLSFHMRLHEKTNSLQADRKESGSADDPTFPAVDDLERFLYGNAAFNLEVTDSTFLSTADVSTKTADESITDWEEMKKQLKQDHLIITRRVSRRLSAREAAASSVAASEAAGQIGGLDPTEHFYFKPVASRKDAENSLNGCPEGLCRCVSGRHLTRDRF